MTMDQISLTRRLSFLFLLFNFFIRKIFCASTHLFIFSVLSFFLHFLSSSHFLFHSSSLINKKPDQITLTNDSHQHQTKKLGELNLQIPIHSYLLPL